MPRILLSLVVTLSMVSVAFSQEVGETVVVIRDIQIGTGTEPNVAKSELLTVEEIRPDALRVSAPEMPNRKALDGWVSRKDLILLDEALPFFDAEIQTRPSAYAHSVRGMILNHKEQFDQAIEAYTAALTLQPGVAAFHHDRGYSWERKKQFEKALADYEESIRLDPANPEPYNDAAWIRATCPDARWRDARKAVDSATKACELVEFQDWNYLDTLAAAHAEAGDFASAVKRAQEALKLAPAEDREDMQARLKLFQSGKPYRDTEK